MGQGVSDAALVALGRVLGCPPEAAVGLVGPAGALALAQLEAIATSHGPTALEMEVAAALRSGRLPLL